MNIYPKNYRIERRLPVIIATCALATFYCWIFFWATPVWATAYYLRADGAAENKTAAVGPCRNVKAAMSVAAHNAQSFNGGDTIYLCDDGGDYKSSIIAPSSGTDEQPITYTNAPGTSPKIDLTANVPNKGWALLANGVYRNSGFARLFFEDNMPLEEATSEDCNDGNWYYRLGSNRLHYRPTSGKPVDHQIEVLWFDTLHSPSGLDLSNKSNIKVFGLSFDRCGTGIYFGQNLDTPFARMKSINICNNTFQRVHWGIFSLLGTSGIASNVKIIDNRIENASCGISVWTNSDKTPGHSQHHSAYEIMGNNILNLNHISDSLLWTQAWKPGYALDHEAISFQDIQNSVIARNIIATRVADTKDRLRGIYFYLTNGKAPTSGNFVMGNKISGVFWPAIYISADLGNAGFENNKIAYNVIFSDSPDKNYISFSINTYKGRNPLSGSNYFVNNVIDNFNGAWGISSTSGLGGNGTWIIRNNIIKSRGYVSINSASASGFTIDHNIYPDPGWHWQLDSACTFALWQSKWNFDRYGSLIADPLFVSASDFHVKPNSPAINAGIDVGVRTDHGGNPVPVGRAPDIGAYEYRKTE